MKLKIVASSKDVIIFLIFAVFLLYVVCLGVLNIPLLATEGHFYGLNPIAAFSSDHIVTTLVFYAAALGGLFFSVSSYFFEFESGVGFSLDSGKSGGYSDWAKPKEIKTDGTIKKVIASDQDSEYAGIPLISNGKELWVDNGEYHNLVIGATGSGKTVNTILPTVKILAKKRESIICTDPKGEIYEKTGGLLKQRGYNIILLNFRNPQNGNAWNPLSLPYKLYKNGNQDKAIELLDDLALNILYDESSANSDPFWEKTAADYFAGIALAMFEDTTEDKININSINMTATVGEDKFGGSTYIKEYFNYKEPSSASYVNASGTVMAPSETKGGIISVFKQKVKLFASRENLSEMLSYSDFELESIGKQPTAVFIIIQDEKKTYHSLATIFIKQVYETLIDVAQQHGGKLPCRTNFLLDEFANMPPLKDVTTMITAARSRQIRFTMIIQNFAQLNKVYGKDDAETIKGNCGNIIYLISTELAALEEISKLCGEKKSKKDAKTASTPLATVSDLQRMKQFDQIILRLRKSPFKTSFVPDFKIDWGNCVSSKVGYPTREKKEVQIFDIREFVKNKKNQKINEMMASMGGTSSTSNGGETMASNPFGLNKPSSASPDKPKKTPDLSVNDLVKKIDEKLAQIEREEQEQKKKKIESKMLETKLPEENDSKPTLEHKIESSKPSTKKIDNYQINEYSTLKEKETPVIDNNKKQENTKSKFTNETEIEILDDSDIKPITTKHNLKDTISTIEIENKVNSKMADDALFELESGIDLLMPIENKNNSEKKNLSKDTNQQHTLSEHTPKRNDDYIYTKTYSTVDQNEKYKANINTNINNENDLDKYYNKEYEQQSMISSLDKRLKEQAANNNAANNKPSTSTDTTPPKMFKPTPTIRLEDVSDDDKFFDDFFED